MKKILATLCVAVTATFGAVAAYAQNSGGSGCTKNDRVPPEFCA